MSHVRKVKFSVEQIGVIERFVETFVLPSKRQRSKKLLLGNSEQRIEALQRLPDWIDPILVLEITDGRSEIPVGLGSLAGYLIDHTGATRVTLAEAEEVAQGGFGALFIADSGNIGLVVPEVGPPILVH